MIHEIKYGGNTCVERKSPLGKGCGLIGKGLQFLFQLDISNETPGLFFVVSLCSVNPAHEKVHKPPLRKQEVLTKYVVFSHVVTVHLTNKTTWSKIWRVLAYTS